MGRLNRYTKTDKNGFSIDYDVFISYSTKDRDIAHQVCYIFEQNLLKCWIAPRNISSGKNYRDEIENGVKHSAIVVVIYSKNSNVSKFVHNEVNLAFSYTKPILSFNIDESMPGEEMEYYLKEAHCLPAYPNPQDSYVQLITDAMELVKEEKNTNFFLPSTFLEESDYSTDIENGNLKHYPIVHDVFISHEDGDDVIADRICDVLEQNNLKCWMETRDIPQGDTQGDEIFDALRGSASVVLIYSKNSDESELVQDEIETAYKLNKPIIAFKIDETFPKRDKCLLYVRKWLEAQQYGEDKFDLLVDTTSKLVDGQKEKNRTLSMIEGHDQTDFAKKSFKYLDELIHGGEKEIILDSNIVLDEGEGVEYPQGIEMDVEGIVIDGNGHSIDARGRTRIFHANAKNITLKNLILKNGSSQEGGSIYNEGDLTLIDCLFADNSASVEGGAVYHRNGFLSSKDCRFYGNYAKEHGGSVVCYSDADFSGCAFVQNSSTICAGLLNLEGTLNVFGCSFEDNQSDESGGAFVNTSTSNLICCSFSNNNAESGGAVIQGGGNLNIEKCIFTNNYAKSTASAFGSGDGETVINNSEFYGNSCVGLGEAINLSRGSVILNNCVFEYNSSYTIHVYGKMNLNDCSLGHNGVGKNDSEIIILEKSAVFNCNDCNFFKNHTYCLANESDNAKILASRFEGNHDKILRNNSKLDVLDCIFSENEINDDYIIFNDENSNLNLSGGKISANKVNGQLIINKGNLSVNQLIFEDNDFENAILNKNKLNLTEPIFKNPDDDILNEGHIDVRKLSHAEVESRIKNIEGASVEEFGQYVEGNLDFTYLNDLIENAQIDDDGRLLIELENDISLENYELDFFEGGIELVRDNLIIDGKNKTIDGKNRTRIFNIMARNVTLKNITFKNGFCRNEFEERTTGGGAVKNIRNSSVQIENCRFINNHSKDDGGAILNNGMLMSKNNKFHGNNSKFNGGAIENNGILEVLGDEYEGNSSKFGGAIYNRRDMKIHMKIKALNNVSDIEEPIFNADSLYLEDASTDCDELIFNSGYINPSFDWKDSFNDFADALASSNSISLKEDIRCSYDCKLKDIVIDRDCEIDGNGHVIDLNNLNVNFIVNAKATFKNITFKNAYILEKSLFDINEDIVFENTVFINNKISNDSTLLKLNEDVHMTVENCRFSNNSSRKASLLHITGTFEISDSIFINNHSLDRGGIINSEPTLGTKQNAVSITASIFKYNSSKNWGGAIIGGIDFIFDIKKSQFISNESDMGGGAIFVGGESKIIDTSFESNFGARGGAIYNQSDKLELVNCSFKDNTAEKGGAIYDIEITMEQIDCTFTDNSPDDIF